MPEILTCSFDNQFLVLIIDKYKIDHTSMNQILHLKPVIEPNKSK